MTIYQRRVHHAGRWLFLVSARDYCPCGCAGHRDELHLWVSAGPYAFGLYFYWPRLWASEWTFTRWKDVGA